MDPCGCATDAVATICLQRGMHVRTNNILACLPADTHFDASKPDFVASMGAQRPSWIIASPPYSLATKAIANSLRLARKGVAMTLPLSFLEPTEERETFLSNNPPSRLLILPRCTYGADYRLRIAEGIQSSTGRSLALFVAGFKHNLALHT
jgi:hypothetical protein